MSLRIGLILPLLAYLALVRAHIAIIIAEPGYLLKLTPINKVLNSLLEELTNIYNIVS